MSYKILKVSTHSQARLGLLKTAHGVIPTPFFMPIATRGAVKTLRSKDLKNIPADIILGNTYHLFFKPGLKILKKAGGLHKFMDWPGPILTDSGGYQVFSLGGNKDFGSSHKNLVKITSAGVEFRSVYDGSRHLFTPKKALEIQSIIGSDIRMVLDVCSPSKCSYATAEKDLEITLAWAKSSQTANVGAHHDAPGAVQPKHSLFGIVQGALYRDLRLRCIMELKKLNFDGYALGGLAVGETPQEMYKVLDYTTKELPADKPRYLMGVGYPEQIVEAVKRGIDMFDCVIPTREARHGRLYFFNSIELSSIKLKATRSEQSRGKNLKLSQDFYHTINIKSQKFASDLSPINSKSKIPELRNYSKAYLRHLFSVEEPLALQLSTLNNVEFYLQLMGIIRDSIKNNKL